MHDSVGTENTGGSVGQRESVAVSMLVHKVAGHRTGRDTRLMWDPWKGVTMGKLQARASRTHGKEDITHKLQEHGWLLAHRWDAVLRRRSREGLGSTGTAVRAWLAVAPNMDAALGPGPARKQYRTHNQTFWSCPNSTSRVTLWSREWRHRRSHATNA